MKKEWNIYFLLYDCVEVLDFSGPFDVFSMANLGIKAPATPCTEPGRFFKLHTVSETGEMVTALHGLKVQPDYSFENCPVDEIDLLIIPGSGPSTVMDFIAKNQPVIDWVSARKDHVEIMASVCVGALILGKAGGFDHLKATTHHGALKELPCYAPTAEVVPGARYVDNTLENGRRVLSSAGVSAGMDLAFYILRNIIGNDALANNTATVMEYNGTSNWVFGTFDPIDWD